MAKDQAVYSVRIYYPMALFEQQLLGTHITSLNKWIGDGVDLSANETPVTASESAFI